MYSLFSAFFTKTHKHKLCGKGKD